MARFSLSSLSGSSIMQHVPGAVDQEEARTAAMDWAAMTAAMCMSLVCVTQPAQLTDCTLWTATTPAVRKTFPFFYASYLTSYLCLFYIIVHFINHYSYISSTQKFNTIAIINPQCTEEVFLCCKYQYYTKEYIHLIL